MEYPSASCLRSLSFTSQSSIQPSSATFLHIKSLYHTKKIQIPAYFHLLLLSRPQKSCNSKTLDMALVAPFVETCVYIGQAVGTLILGLVEGINDKDHNAEIQFTQNMCDQLRATFPSKNIMIVHSNYSANLVNAQKAHVECPVTWPRTQGYTCIGFDSGIFQLKGDGGFENWCYNGNYTNNGNGSVTFHHIDGESGCKAFDVSLMAANLNSL